MTPATRRQDSDRARITTPIEREDRYRRDVSTAEVILRLPIFLVWMAAGELDVILRWVVQIGLGCALVWMLYYLGSGALRLL